MAQTNSEKMAAADLSAALEVRRQKQVAEPSQMVVLPFGKMVDAKKYIEARPSFQARGANLVQFDKIIKEYDPEHYVYAWPVAEDPETVSRINVGVYIPLTKDDINAAGTLVTHEGPEEDRVRWYRHILVKIPKAYAEELYEEPKARALQGLVKLENWTRDESSRIGHSVGAEVTIEKRYGK